MHLRGLVADPLAPLGFTFYNIEDPQSHRKRERSARARALSGGWTICAGGVVVMTRRAVAGRSA
jgi:hypothetical protein